MFAPQLGLWYGPSVLAYRKSIRFRGGNQRLIKTFSSTGNRQKWSLSVWLKRGISNQYLSLFNNIGTTTTDYGGIRFMDDGRIEVFNNGKVAGGAGSTVIVQTAVFRDPAAWYHVVIATDTTQAIQTDRVKIWVNNALQTTVGFPSSQYPAQNYLTHFNLNVQHAIGCQISSTPSNDFYYHGNMAEFYWLDGATRTPSDFAEINSSTRQWLPKTYIGAGYGTNGFYLSFQDQTTTSSLGVDTSGNGNNWTVENMSVTRNLNECDAIDDYPDNNFSTLHNLYNHTAATTKSSLLNGALGVSLPNSAISDYVFSTHAITADAYFEVTLTTIDLANGGEIYVLINQNYSRLGPRFHCIGVRVATGVQAEGVVKFVSGTEIPQTGTTASYVNGDKLQFWVEPATGSVRIMKNGTYIYRNPLDSPKSFDVSFTPSNGPLFLMVGGKRNSTINVNFGQQGFSSQLAPSLTLTETAADPIEVSTDSFRVSLDTASSIKTTSENQFTNQLAWLKGRSDTGQHQLIDSVRGTSNVLRMPSTVNETTYTQPTSNSVAWIWKLNGAGTTNTAGSISSQVSADQISGISVVSYTGNSPGPTGGISATVGHGLGRKPDIIILRDRNSNAINTWQNWVLGPANFINSWDQILLMQAAIAQISGADTTPFNDTAANDTIFNLKQFTGAGMNFLGTNYIAYCFASTPGFSQFGNFPGTANAEGPFVYLGFTPKFLMLKGSTSATSWMLYDSSRFSDNPNATYLVADAANVEDVNAVRNVEFLSNGFKVRSSNSAINGSGQTMVYMAFAEFPFRYANAYPSHT
jgi:3D (Asp-Asp-Asp) domain-containing protein